MNTIGRWALALALLITILPTLQASAAPSTQVPYSGPVQRDVTYCSPGGVAEQMDIYFPNNGSKAPAPTVLYVHGGSWVAGDKYEIGLGVAPLTAKGYLVASINYRLAPQYKWPAQIQDAKCAVRYLRANATKYNIDPNRIAAWGSSAGGHLVDLLGLTGPNAGFQGDGEYGNQSDSVQAVVDMFGPTDLTLYSPNQDTTGLGSAVFNVHPGQSTDVLVKASPVTYVHENAPPFLILQGNKDTTVPPSQSQELYDKLKAAGDDATLVMVNNAGHAFVPVGGPISPSINEIANMILNFLNRTIGTQTQTSQFFTQTGHTVSGVFLDYWQEHGGVAQNGYPVSEQMQEKSPTDGKVYTVQYFERAEFQYHPENQPPNNVLLALLGSMRYRQKYPKGAPGQVPNTSGSLASPNSGSVLFPQTGKRLGGRFLDYWNSHGGLAQQGYPISDEFTEISPINGKPYTVQYFERAVFEYHPENKAPYDVLLSQLGNFEYQVLHAKGK